MAGVKNVCQVGCGCANCEWENNESLITPTNMIRKKKVQFSEEDEVQIIGRWDKLSDMTTQYLYRNCETCWYLIALSTDIYASLEMDVHPANVGNTRFRVHNYQGWYNETLSSPANLQRFYCEEHGTVIDECFIEAVAFHSRFNSQAIATEQVRADDGNSSDAVERKICTEALDCRCPECCWEE
jgi:hypothetical protein